MATTTSTLAVSGVPPKALHAGPTTVYGTVTVAPTVTASDVVKLFRLPDRARVVSGYLNFEAHGISTQADWKWGYLRPATSTDSGSLLDNNFLLSTTLTSIHYELSTSNGVGYQVSASDDSVYKFVTVQLENVGSGTHSATTIIKFSMTYLVEDN